MSIAARASPAAPRRRRLRLALTTPALLGLPLAWLAVFFLVPIAIVAAYSFDVYSIDPGPRLHARGVAPLPAQLHLPVAVLEVREDVADRLGDHRPARLPARVLPGALRDEAEVRAAA